MGVTIHFEGRVASIAQYEKLITCAKDFAEENQMPWTSIDQENGVLLRYKDGDLVECNGPVLGIVIEPDPGCEPFFVRFDKDLYIQEFCKTQYANISIHILMVDLLRQLEGYFEELNVVDDGGYWDTSDINILQKHFDVTGSAIENLKRALGSD